MSTATAVPDKVKPMNTIQAVNMALDEAMGLDANVILLGEDIADGQEGGIVGVTKGLSTKYGNARVRSTPIAEQAIVGAAMSLVGDRLSAGELDELPALGPELAQIILTPYLGVEEAQRAAAAATP